MVRGQVGRGEGRLVVFLSYLESRPVVHLHDGFARLHREGDDIVEELAHVLRVV